MLQTQILQQHMLLGRLLRAWGPSLIGASKAMSTEGACSGGPALNPRATHRLQQQGQQQTTASALTSSVALMSRPFNFYGRGSVPWLNCRGAPCMPAVNSLAHPQRGHSSWAGRGGIFGFMSPGRRVVDTLLAVNAAAFLAQKLFPWVSARFARVNMMVDQGEYWRLLTAAFLHGDVLHLLVNCLSLHWMGPGLEAAVGPRIFTAVYLASAVSGNWLGYLLQGQYVASMGSSSAISGIFGGYLTYRLMNRHVMPLGGSELSWVAQILVLNLAINYHSSSIDGWSHLGGLLGGAAMMLLVGPRYRY